MCGFAGIYGSNLKKQRWRGALSSMSEELAPRGPDAKGFWEHNDALFIHRRLRIIDLSENAAQPMHDKELGITILFNGCIYNYKTLRTKLVDLGYSFKSTSDTEVILKAFHRWGPDCLQKLNGMFSIAIFNETNGELFIARDRLGIKPLYYHKLEKEFLFASTLPTLLRGQPNKKWSLDVTSLQYYLNFHSVVPAPNTIVSEIRKLPPAHWGLVKGNGDFTIKRYWSLDYNDKYNDSKDFLVDKCLNMLDQAVHRRLEADVPVGVLLSGGVDSSLITALISKHKKNSDLHTFSIGFESLDKEDGDEFQYSDIIAKEFNTNHHQIKIGSNETLENLDSCIRAMSEPMMSHDNIGFYLLSREVSKDIKVVQSGQGADEVFAGYHWYPPMNKASAEEAPNVYRGSFFDRSFAEYSNILKEAYVNHHDKALEFVKQHFSNPGVNLSLDKALRLDLQVMLAEDPVKRVDNNTMAWGLEARVPFLDHELLEFAARLPPHLKLKNDGKYLLKEVARKVIPSSVIDRPKGYFPVPALKYLRGQFLKYVEGIFNHSTSIKGTVVREQYLNMLLREPEKHISTLRGSKLWQLTILERWLQLHRVRI